MQPYRKATCHPPIVLVQRGEEVLMIPADRVAKTVSDELAGFGALRVKVDKLAAIPHAMVRKKVGRLAPATMPRILMALFALFPTL